MILLRRHPFAPLFESGQISTQYKQHIASHAVWLEDPALGHPPPQSAQVPISILPRQMHDLFRRALQMNAATRPQAKEWAAALTEALDSVYRCSCGREFVNEPTRYRCYGCGAAAAPYELHIGGKKLSLATMSTVLGRDALGGDLHVSREHAVFERRGFGLRVTNLSANGLAVKDTSGWSVMRQGERRELSDGDRVRFAVGVEGIVCAAR